jgi:NADH dehydrogenase
MTLVTVFGGTGFLGRRIVERLAQEGMTVRVAVRFPQHHHIETDLKRSGRTVTIAADVRDKVTVATAVAGAEVVINAVSAYVEKGDVTYTAVHEHGAYNVAKECDQQNVGQLVYVSGIGAEPASPSAYIRARGRGELGVREAFPGATILRPSVMFAEDDAFLNVLARIARSPVIPLVGGGYTRLQPVHVNDVAKAVCMSLRLSAARGTTYELGGPESHTLREILEMILARAERRRIFVSVPFVLVHPLAQLLEFLPRSPLTVAQVDLLKHDNIPATDAPGFKELGVVPRKLDDTLASIIKRLSIPQRWPR